MRKVSLILFTVLFWHISFAQTNNFELTYGEYSLMPFEDEATFPLIHIKKDGLYFTYTEETSRFSEIQFYGDKNDKADTIWIDDTITKCVKFRQGSIDSIIQILEQINPKRFLEHNLIFASNPYIIDGSMIDINIIYGKKKKIRFELGNTFDSTALRIVNIINPYLPNEHKMEIPYSEWKRDIEYKRRDDSIYRKK